MPTPSPSSSPCGFGGSLDLPFDQHLEHPSRVQVRVSLPNRSRRPRVCQPFIQQPGQQFVELTLCRSAPHRAPRLVQHTQHPAAPRARRCVTRTPNRHQPAHTAEQTRLDATTSARFASDRHQPPRHARPAQETKRVLPPNRPFLISTGTIRQPDLLACLGNLRTRRGAENVGKGKHHRPRTPTPCLTTVHASGEVNRSRLNVSTAVLMAPISPSMARRRATASRNRPRWPSTTSRESSSSLRSATPRL